MNPILLIARKDLRSYFYSPIAYIILAAFLFLVGYMFSQLLSFHASSLQQYGTFNTGPAPTLGENLIRPLFGNMNVVLLFIAPFISMRLLSEETKDHTIELLLTAPVRPIQIVLGKFLAGVAFLSSMIACTLVYVVILSLLATPDWGLLLGCYLGILAMICTYVALGLFWSSRTENQIVAAALTFGSILFLWLIGWSAHRAGPVWSDVLNHLSIINHYNNFALGLIDTSDLVFFLTFTGFGLFLTNLSLDKQ